MHTHTQEDNLLQRTAHSSPRLPMNSPNNGLPSVSKSMYSQISFVSLPGSFSFVLVRSLSSSFSLARSLGLLLSRVLPLKLPPIGALPALSPDHFFSRCKPLLLWAASSSSSSAFDCNVYRRLRQVALAKLLPVGIHGEKQAKKGE